MPEQPRVRRYKCTFCEVLLRKNVLASNEDLIEEEILHFLTTGCRGSFMFDGWFPKEETHESHQ